MSRAAVVSTDRLPHPSSSRAPAHRKTRSKAWRPGILTIFISVFAIVGLALALYPSTAAWLTSYNQSILIQKYSTDIESVNPAAATQLDEARAYNSLLTAGVELEADSHVPEGTGTLADARLVYEEILRVNSDGLMARIRIPSIDVDLPIYHGTSDETLLRGAGHLKGSHLPIGGKGTHSVITAHRGLANATMFTNLDRVKVGDTFTISVFGEVLTYRVRETKVVEPEDTKTLLAVPGKDLVTLVTCTPLGINTHRILVTGERVTPTPLKDIVATEAPPEIPGFPYWVAQLLGGLILICFYVWRSGYTDARIRDRKRSPEHVGEVKASDNESSRGPDHERERTIGIRE